MGDDSLDTNETREFGSAPEGGSLSAGDVIGEYRIVRLLGRGGMGEVYLAEHVQMHKQYAVKILPAELSRDAQFISRFRVEARVMADLSHSRIVHVNHMGEDGGRHYLTMDYVEGPDGQPRTLEDELAAVGKLPEARVRALALQICDAVGYAHGFEGEGVIHRDLKPANILLDVEGNVRVADFGLAKVLGSEYLQSVIDRSIQLSMAGQLSVGERDTDKRTSSARAILGTYDYMSPEQKAGGEVGPRSDIYSLGVMLYRMLTGEKPEGSYRAPSRYGASKRWDRILTRCMERRAADRYSSVAALRAAINQGKRRWPRLLAAASVLGVLAAGGWFWSQRQPAGDDAGMGVSPGPVGPASPNVVAAVPEPSSAATDAPPSDALPLLRIRLRPPGASVLIVRENRKIAEVGPLDAEGLDVPLDPGAYTISVDLAGYRPIHEKVVVDDDGVDWDRALTEVTGELLVRSDPGVRIAAVDRLGRRTDLGVADKQGRFTHEQLRLGAYRVILSRPDYQSATATVEIAEGRVAEVREGLRGLPGELRVTSAVDAEIWEAGKRLGRTNRTIGDLPPGEREVELRRAGYRTQRLRVRVPPNGVVVEAAPAAVAEAGAIRVRVRSTDEGDAYLPAQRARARIGEDPWRTFAAAEGLLVEGLSCEAHAVAVEIAGYRSEPLERVVVRDGETGEATVILKPLPARLRVRANAPGAEVYVNGVRVGLAGAVLELPSLVACKLEVRAAGHATAMRAFGALDPGKTYKDMEIELEARRLPSDLVEVAAATYAPLAGLAAGSGEAQGRQRQAVERLGLPLEAKSAKAGIAFRLAPAGTFAMGSPAGEANRGADERRHEVELTRPLYVGKYEVTQGEWERVMDSNPSKYKGGKRPVETVSWEDCQEFVRKLCRLEGVPTGTYRLLTEAEWEYACRAGTAGAYAGELDKLGWHGESYERGPHPVGGKQANAWGLHDMHGNVWEWCNDWYSSEYAAGRVRDPGGPSSGEIRVFRGGCWSNSGQFCRSANRDGNRPGYRGSVLGFRLARDRLSAPSAR